VAAPEATQTNWGSVADWVAGVATFLAVLVALFKDQFLQWWRRPVLKASLRPGPPDCARTMIAYQAQGVVPSTLSANAYYLRLWIENAGRSRADKVQVFAAKLLKKATAGGAFEPVSGFLPMNLRWSHSQGAPEVYADGISPKMGKHCDLAHIIDPAFRVAVGEDHPDALPAQTVLALELEVLPNTGSHLIPPGEYRLTLQIAAANCEPSSATVALNITGHWYIDEKRMFSDGIGLQVTPH
jgi:hypothetical protein